MGTKSRSNDYNIGDSVRIRPDCIELIDVSIHHRPSKLDTYKVTHISRANGTIFYDIEDGYHSYKVVESALLPDTEDDYASEEIPLTGTLKFNKGDLDVGDFPDGIIFSDPLDHDKLHNLGKKDEYKIIEVDAIVKHLFENVRYDEIDEKYNQKLKRLADSLGRLFDKWGGQV